MTAAAGYGSNIDGLKAAYQFRRAAVWRIRLTPEHVIGHQIVIVLQGAAEPAGPDRNNVLQDLAQRPQERVACIWSSTVWRQ